jgi:hypothetical protein
VKSGRDGGGPGQNACTRLYIECSRGKVGAKMLFLPQKGAENPHKITSLNTGAGLGCVSLSWCDVTPQCPPGTPGKKEFKPTLMSPSVCLSFCLSIHKAEYTKSLIFNKGITTRVSTWNHLSFFCSLSNTYSNVPARKFVCRIFLCLLCITIPN